MMSELHKIVPLGFNETSINISTTIARPLCISYTSNQFFVQCKMNISNLVFVQIKFKLFTIRYVYIHSFPMPMGYIHGG
jgi:hypothetical protein